MPDEPEESVAEVRGITKDGTAAELDEAAAEAMNEEEAMKQQGTTWAGHQKIKVNGGARSNCTKHSTES